MAAQDVQSTDCNDVQPANTFSVGTKHAGRTASVNAAQPSKAEVHEPADVAAVLPERSAFTRFSQP